MKLVIILLMFLLLISNASAAIIHGKVYDIELNKINNVVVEINTVPKQRIISQEGEYFFNVQPGSYIINARASIKGIAYFSNESISIVNNDEYIIDLFLFPDLKDVQNVDIKFDDDNKKSPYIIVISAIIIIIGLILLFKFRKKKNKKIIIDNDEELDNIYNLIKKEKRTTQKEIRKNSSLSEAKISLIITQLEKEGKIQKIKKGRTNIIILKQ